MSNSPLIRYRLISPFQSGKRTHRIDRITPHCVVGQVSAESCAQWFQNPKSGSSSNYIIGADGGVACAVDEDCRSWCSSSASNDQRAVTIECASAKVPPYEMYDAVFSSLIELCVDICKRNGKKKLLWFNDKNKSLAYNPNDDEMVITVHRWFANKPCPGDWLYNRLGILADEVTKQLEDKPNTAEFLDYNLVYDEPFYRNLTGNTEDSLYCFFNFLGAMDNGVRGSFWFDPKYYRSRYEDLNVAFGDNWKTYYEHYMIWGLKEGRYPIDISHIFDWRFYRDKYSDLREAFGDNAGTYATHFMIYGMTEGRQASAEFSPTNYKARYPDLQAAFGDDMKSYYRHYLEYGLAEGRDGR